MNNYLVDFKNVGFELSTTTELTSSSTSSPSSLTSQSESDAPSSLSSNQQDSPYSPKFESNNKFLTPPITSTTVRMLHQQRTDGKEVTSMYPFFDVCTKLITELAISG